MKKDIKKQLEVAKKIVERTQGFLIENKGSRMYIDLYENLEQHLEEIDDVSKQRYIHNVIDDKVTSIDNPYIVISELGQPLDESTILELSDFDNHEDLLWFIDDDFLVKKHDRYLSIIEELKKSDLSSSFSNPHNNTTDLIFTIKKDGLFVQLNNVEILDKFDNGDFFISHSGLQEIIENIDFDDIEIKGYSLL